MPKQPVDQITVQTPEAFAAWPEYPLYAEREQNCRQKPMLGSSKAARAE